MRRSPPAAPRNVRLRMAGGRLTGDMSGAGNLVYLGTVSEQSVDPRRACVNIRRATSELR